MFKRVLCEIAIIIVLSFVLGPALQVKADVGDVPVSVTVLPADATGFVATDIGGGSGECGLNWTTSVTPNIDNQALVIDGPQGPGVSLTLRDLNPFPGSTTPDDISFYPPNTNITDLVIGWTYIFTLTSEAGVLQSSGVVTTCTPSSNLPAPNIQAEPGVTEGTSNTIFFDNNGVVDGVDAINLTCNVRASLENLALDPAAATVAESGWNDCSNPAQTYSHTFNSLTIGETYFYDVQSQDNDPDPLNNEGLSPYSDVVFSTQFEDTGGGGDPDPPPAGGGGGTDPVCGNNLREPGEECDDGNTINGDGCSAACEEELPECGDGILDAGEACDDGNLIDGDGCSSLCEEELLVEVIFDIKGKPEYRTIIDSTPNLGLNSQLTFFKHGAGTLETDLITLDSYGLKEHQRELMTGTYDIALNGEAHNTKIVRDVIILETTERVELDFTFADVFELTAGDIYDDNYVNALDIARMLNSYREEGTNVSDLTKEEIVNALDIAVLLWNYREEGEYFASQAF
ncbi:DUF4215 domain-containing protein [Patescibacteria group bacterium]